MKTSDNAKMIVGVSASTERMTTRERLVIYISDAMSLPVLRSTNLMERLVRWDPRREFEDIYERLSRLMEPMVRTIGEQIGMGTWTPVVNVSEAGDVYLIEVELPGIKREGITIEMIGNELIIVGEMKERERTQSDMIRRSRRAGQFEYRTMGTAWLVFILSRYYDFSFHNFVL